KGIETCEVNFVDFRVPVANLVGGVKGRGLEQVLSGLEVGRISIASRTVAVAPAAFEGAPRSAQQRNRLGKPAYQHLAITRRHQRDPPRGDRPQPGAAVQDLRLAGAEDRRGRRRALVAVAVLAAVGAAAGLRWLAPAPRPGASPAPPGSAPSAPPAAVVPPLALPAHPRVVVFAPHPDDETVGLGGLLVRLAQAHVPLRVVFVTNGDGYRRALQQDFDVERPTDADYVALGEL